MLTVVLHTATPAATAGGSGTAGLLARAGLLGFATGIRSTLGLAALGLSTPTPLPPAAGHRLGWRRLARPVPTGLAVTALAGELVADKLPSTPSRLEPPVLGGRIVLGATAGGLLARRQGRGAVAPGLIAGIGALAGSIAGFAWRDWAAQEMPDWAAALIEDGIGIGLAEVATIPGRAAPSVLP